MADNYNVHCVSYSFCAVYPPPSALSFLYPSFPAAFCPLNQSRVRFREEVNTLVLWLGPFLQRGLCNWKALGDYFKTLVGTDSHVCAMAGNGALSFSLAFTDCLTSMVSLPCSLLWLPYCTEYTKKSNRSVKQISAISPGLLWQKRLVNFTIARGKKTVLSQLAVCFRAGFLLRPSVLHTALQSPTANIPQTKINVVSLWVKCLNKQKYQQSASSLCPWVGHNRLFVQLKL